jgi:hypothetical protein
VTDEIRKKVERSALRRGRPQKVGGKEPLPVSHDGDVIRVPSGHWSGSGRSSADSEPSTAGRPSDEGASGS